MKVATTLLVSAWLLFSSVLGDGHSLCACQSRSNGPTVDSATQACCSRVGAHSGPPASYRGNQIRRPILSGQGYKRRPILRLLSKQRRWRFYL
ncbi:hypothetical protein BHE90_017749, partial [Fusarium euwallaceae]